VTKEELMLMDGYQDFYVDGGINVAKCFISGGKAAIYTEKYNRATGQFVMQENTRNLHYSAKHSNWWFKFTNKYYWMVN